MYDICVFAGTTEGRRLVHFLSDTSLSVFVCVATDYGETLVPQSENVTVSAGRLAQPEIEELFKKEGFRLVIDATHPYATAVTENISAACEAAGAPYLRLCRGAEKEAENAVYVGSIQEAAAYLSGTAGNVLVTTGSKELLPYTEINSYKERLFVRVLPVAASIEACEKCGFSPSRIIAMQGPFSQELNRALLRDTNAKFLVTKDTGSTGGFYEKLEAAREEDAVCVIIGRPTQVEGTDFQETIREICTRFDIDTHRQISVIGIGMGSSALLTAEAAEALKTSDCVIGAKRVIEAVAGGKPCFPSMDNAKILAFIKSHPEYVNVAIVMSGDTGFYSGTKKLLLLLKDYKPRVYPGISSLQYFCAKLAISWDDVHVISLHGRRGSVVQNVKEHKKIFALVGGSGAVNNICTDLVSADLDGVYVSVGERLSYNDEKITTGPAKELKHMCFDPLSVVLITNDRASMPKRVCGLPDEAFIRSTEKTTVPMTKSEVRAISIAKLMLSEDSVVYDIGAGTGSVSVEAAGISALGHVYAIEFKKAAVELIRKNQKRFGLSNITVVEGKAPEACASLPPPTHVFVGGSSGNMSEIIRMLLEKNPNVRIVMNLVSLESIADMTSCLTDFSYENAEIVQVTVAKTKKLGSHHLMNGQNPITIVTLQKTAEGTKN